MGGAGGWLERRQRQMAIGHRVASPGGMAGGAGGEGDDNLVREGRRDLGMDLEAMRALFAARASHANREHPAVSPGGLLDHHSAAARTPVFPPFLPHPGIPAIPASRHAAPRAEAAAAGGEAATSQAVFAAQADAVQQVIRDM